MNTFPRLLSLILFRPSPPVIIFLIFFLAVILFLHTAIHILWLKPKRTERIFWNQGLRGPPYRFLIGNLGEMASLMLAAAAEPMNPPVSHHILPRVLSFYNHWKKTHGSAFLLWFGTTPRLAVADPELIRNIFVTQAALFERYNAHPLIRQLEGEGLVNLHGSKWALHRKLISPVFHIDNLKLLLPAVGEKMMELTEKVAAAAAAAAGGDMEVEIDVAEWYQRMTEEAVNRTTFGRCCQEGKVVLKLQKELMVLSAEAFNRLYFPGYRFLPTEKNRRRWKLRKEIEDKLLELVTRRREKGAAVAAGEVKDLIGQMSLSTKIAVNDVVEECKTFLFAGKQTTTNLLTWTTVLLAMHPEWQDRARDELLHVCGSRDFPSNEDLPKLKTLGMIVKETLRLYPPAVATIRRSKADIALGCYRVPQGIEILVPIIAVHHDPVIWGSDVERFNPARFAEGVSRAAKHPYAFMPFGHGERTCVGRGLAMLEAKLALAAVLRRFELRVSPNYIHAPTVLMMLYPQYGAPVIFRLIS
ncbi:Cytochrome P450 734A6 [Platanthera zijinensis]|uniref:Cytochrome P450 734A6 n=1 Tax=Platanthera zijinensis TaxID=2320716 RepID=A0AAP0B950_9ASPA